MCGCVCQLQVNMVIGKHEQGLWFFLFLFGCLFGVEVLGLVCVCIT